MTRRVEIVYALINNASIQNKIVCSDYETANQLAKAAYGNDAFAVECTQYKCNIGDLFENNTFYYLAENGEKIKCEYIPTPEQEIEALKNEIEIMTEYSLDNDYRLSVMELEL